LTWIAEVSYNENTRFADATMKLDDSVLTHTENGQVIKHLWEED